MADGCTEWNPLGGDLSAENKAGDLRVGAIAHNRPPCPRALAR